MDRVRKHQEKLATALLIVTIFLAGFVIGQISSITQAQDSQFAIGSTEQAFEPVYEVFESIRARYVNTNNVDVLTLIDGAITGMIESLDDPYSSYMDPTSFEMFTSDLSGDVEGIGVVIRTEEETGRVVVVSLIRGAAAEAAGVLPGDIFLDVDGVSVEGLDQSQLATRVRGPQGTEVVITFLRGEERITLTITRVRFEVPNVEYELLEGNIAYIRLGEFNDRSREQLDAAIADLDVNSRAGLIFDLRGNPGGLLSAAIDIASIFVEEGVIIYEAFGDGSEQVFEANGNYANITVPIVVLVNEGSASASELVSGAMQDLGAAVLIGETTFGKGTVQTLQPLSNNGALRLTIARYLLPSRRWIHDTGVEPNIVVPYDIVTDGADIDPQLDAALDYLIGNAGN
ncbi:MAG: S41 family peptidase [Anaerolineae bacterium]|nr:S41 family peptidase [Anaerolineae bacterium]MDQ7035150.1 S41 family peptidase [Anaerolineae bacterium]